MKPVFKIALLSLSLASTSVTATSWESSPPPEYRFSWKTTKRGDVVATSVCNEYTGSRWKECRRYAQWYFAKQCWELGYQEKHAAGDARRRILKDKDIACRASKTVRPAR